ncbi:glycosyltransferase family 2 protein, partial [Candidatus Gottesmanbacteria bacterium]|nr:glycosyltransferase family 2 protein [Candidatus Gottesmanbacteria bacterium]
CLDSIFQNTSKEFLKATDIIVVDNSSGDGTQEMLKKEFKNITIIENKENVGFAKANNQGIRKAKGEFILLLNSDTLIGRDSLEKSLDYIKSQENIGVLGCKLTNTDGTLQYSAGYLPNLIKISLWMEFIDDIPFINRLLHPYHIDYPEFYDMSQKVGWVTGAFFLIRKKALDKIGFLDQNLFMYGEELEFCFRLKQQGWDIVYYRDAKITHHKGSSGVGSISGLVEEFAALKYIWKKHYPHWQYPILRLQLKFGALLRLLLFGIILGKVELKDIYAKAFKLA